MIAKFDSRDYGYTVISRFELFLRNICVEKLDDVVGIEFLEIPAGVIEVAKGRNEKVSSLPQLLENIDFIHIKEIIIYKNNYSKFFNQEYFDKETFKGIMDSLYGLRCKIAHIRSYFTNSDLMQLITELRTICEKIDYDCNSLLRYVDRLLDDPSGLVQKIPLSFFEEDKKIDIINNLPVADYEYEGGFVGRQDDKTNIIKMIKSGMHRVITLSGAGGVGKSALTLNIVNEIIRNQIVKYDFIIWVSAKENKLSYLGIEDVEPTLRNYEELLDTILEVIGFDVEEYYGNVEKKEEDINTIFDSCERVLLVIDNLETITDQRIINFILDSHPKTHIIITSRRGLGQVERRYELKELREKDAIHLFRVICREKQLSALAQASEDIIKKYVNKVYCYPLAIKWMVGQVSLGKDINEVTEKINEQSSDISKFCFEEIFKNLSERARYILYILCMYDDAVSKGILQYLSNLEELIFEEALDELLLVSLIVPEQRINKENEEINSYYSLLPLTRGYVKTQLDIDADLKSQIQEKIVTVDTTIEEAERAKKQYRFSLSNFGATTEEEKVAVMFATTAYQKYQADNYLEAVELYKQAIAIAPRFASIYRNWAIMESQESHWTDADKLMEKASTLDPNDTQIWLVWGNMKRKNDKIKDAYTYYEKAYRLSPKDNVVLNAYAQAISRMGEYEKADKLYHEALEIVEGIPHNKHLIINYTSIAENLKKWAEALLEDRNYELAEKKIKEALECIEKVLEIASYDSKAQTLYRNVLLTYGNILIKKKNFSDARNMYEKLVSLSHNRYKEIEYHVRASLELAELCVHERRWNEVEKYISKETERKIRWIGKNAMAEKLKWIQSACERDSVRKRGKIVHYSLAKKYIIIEAEEEKATYLTFLNEFSEYINLNDEILLREVSFLGIEENGKKKAKDVKFIGSKASSNE